MLVVKLLNITLRAFEKLTTYKKKIMQNDIQSNIHKDCLFLGVLLRQGLVCVFDNVIVTIFL